MSRKATEVVPPNSELEVTFSVAILELGHFESHPNSGYITTTLPNQSSFSQKLISTYIFQSQPSRVDYFVHKLTDQRVFGYFSKEMGFGNYEHPFLATAKHDVGPA